MKPKLKKTTEATHVLLLGDFGRPPIRDLVRGLLKYSRLHSAEWILYINSPHYESPDLKKITPENIRRWGIHGIVDVLLNPAKTTEILSMDLPHIVLVGAQKNVLGEYVIVSDNARIAEMGANYLLDKKFVNFAYCGIDSANCLDSAGWSHERGEAFVNTITKAGFDVHVYKPPRSKGRYSWLRELSYAADCLKTLPKPHK